MGELLAITGAVFFALSGIVVRRASEHLNREIGFLITVVTNLIVSSLIFGLRILLGGPWRFSGPGLIYFFIGGACALFFGRLFWFKTIGYLGPSRAGTFKTAQVLFVLFIALLFMGEQASAIALFGSACLVAGLYVLSNEGSGSTTPESVSAWRAGILTGWLSAMAFAGGNISRKLAMLEWPDATTGLMVGALAALAGTLLMPETWKRLPEVPKLTRKQRPWNWVLVGCLTSGSQLAIITALGLSPVWVVNILQSVEPIVLPFMSLLFLRGREVLTRRLWLATGLVVAGVVFIALR